MIRRLTLADADSLSGWVGTDCRDFLAEPVNVCLAEGNGGAMFKWLWPGLYEVHVAFEQRGREVIDLSHRMLAWMRENEGASRFVAKVPVQSRHVIMFTRLMGWKPHGFADLAHGRCQLFIGE